MQSKYIHLRKGLVLSVIGLSILLGTLPVIVKATKTVNTQPVQAATIELPMYPGLSWSHLSDYHVAIPHASGTSQESVSVSSGQQTSAVTPTDISDEVLFYYDKLLTDHGFVKTSLVGDPSSDKAWIGNYLSGDKYVEIQYFPNHAEKGTNVIRFFEGKYTDN